MLTGTTDQRGIRGAECPSCHHSTVVDDRPGDGLYRIPAIVLVTRDTLRWTVCQACGWTEALIGDPVVVHSVESLAETGEVVV